MRNIGLSALFHAGFATGHTDLVATVQSSAHKRGKYFNNWGEGRSRAGFYSQPALDRFIRRQKRFARSWRRAQGTPSHLRGDGQLAPWAVE